MSTPLGRAAQIVLIAALYFAAAKLGLALAIPPGYATAIWPPSGIALAALLLFGWRVWPGVWAGAALANFTIQFSAPLACAIATGNTLEALAAAALVRRYVGVSRRFEHGEHVVGFVGAAFASCAVAATVAVVALGAGGFMAWEDSFRNWWTWWQGDIAGIIIITPLLLAWSHKWDFDWTPARMAEFAVFIGLLAAGTMVVFGDWLVEAGKLQLAFLLLPFIIWPAFRFTQREVAAASALMCGIAVWQTVGGSGPFAAHGVNAKLLLLQAFMSTVVVTGLALSAVLDERRRTEEQLRRAHGEMEKFVYVVAHDLQEPLRTVTNFAGLLDRGHRDRLDSEAREFLGHITEGAARMRRILSDLLAFSQVDLKDAAPAAVECEKLLAGALRGLGAALDEAGAAVTHDALPSVTADATLMELLFQNLIGNAVKFRGTAPLRVHVGARRGEGSWVFSVRDNGIGIAPRHFGAIFEMFQRLHGAGRYPGTGIGLTISKKIVERHHGRIWLESQEGAGTTFYFTIPD